MDKDAGNAYNGQIKDGLFHGKGTLIYAGNERYEGDWVHGKREGQGRFTYADGAVFEASGRRTEFTGKALPCLRLGTGMRAAGPMAVFMVTVH